MSRWLWRRWSAPERRTTIRKNLAVHDASSSAAHPWDLEQLVAYRFFEPDSVAFRSSLVLRFCSKANDTQTVVYYFKSVDCRQRTCWRIPGEYAIILWASGGALSRMLVRSFDAFRSVINGSPTTAELVSVGSCSSPDHAPLLHHCSACPGRMMFPVGLRSSSRGDLASGGISQEIRHRRTSRRRAASWRRNRIRNRIWF